MTAPRSTSAPSASPVTTGIRRFSSAFIFIAALLIAAPLAFSQHKRKSGSSKSRTTSDKTTLETKKKNLQAQIDLTNQLLAQTRRNKTLSLGQLVALNKKIEARESFIATINSQIASLDSMIDENVAAVADLDTEILHLKNDYARMIQFAYRNRNAYQQTMFIFSSDDFNQAFQRMKYLQQISMRRREQADTIVARQKILNDNIAALGQQKSDKQQLLADQLGQKQQLAQEKDEKDKTFHDLQTKEQQLKDDLKKKQAEKSSIDKAIQDLIAAEAARLLAAQKAAAAKKNNTSNTTAKNNTTSSNTPPVLQLTPDAVALGNSFAASHGGLPWPVEKGTITGHFGKQPHPVLQGVYVYNNGIDITTIAGANARAVYDGEVTGITDIPGSGWLVIVRHGEYLTVYAKLAQVLVKTGDKVKARQNIGKVADDSDDGQTILHFEVWKGGVGKMDPEEWLLKGN